MTSRAEGQSIKTPQKLQSTIVELSAFFKSLLSSLSKQGRRMLSLKNLQQYKVFNVEGTQSFKFTQFQEYAQLLSKQTHTRLNQEILKKLNVLKQQLSKHQYEMKKNQKEKQIQAKKKLENQHERTVTKNQKKNQIKEDIMTFQQCLQAFQTIKQKFFQIWKEEYFMIMNYRMAITAKQIQRWTQIAATKNTKEHIAKDIEAFFPL